MSHPTPESPQSSTELSAEAQMALPESAWTVRREGDGDYYRVWRADAAEPEDLRVAVVFGAGERAMTITAGSVVRYLPDAHVERPGRMAPIVVRVALGEGEAPIVLGDDERRTIISGVANLAFVLSEVFAAHASMPGADSTHPEPL